MPTPPANPSNLTTKLFEEFPQFETSKVRVIDNGHDHDVLIVDDEWAFRFPRSLTYERVFKQELRLLRELRTCCPVSVPEYELISCKGDFGGYRMIKGQELGADSFLSLHSDVKRGLAAQISTFLSAMHALPPSLLDDSIREERWDSNHLWRFAKRYVDERRISLADFVSTELLGNIDQFYSRFQSMRVASGRLTHGDLSEQHILFDPSRRCLAGIIDFSDAVVGDPAIDFSHLWHYGPNFPIQVQSSYRFGDDPFLLNRSFWYFIRVQIDRLFNALSHQQIQLATAIERRLHLLLARLPEVG